MNPNLRRITERSRSAFCDFCHRNELNDVEWGEMYQFQEFTVHYFCMLFSSGLVQTGEDTEGIQGFMPQDLRKELRRGEKLKCKYCKGNRATVGCVLKQCKYSFHFTCGLSRGTLHKFAENFVSYCPAHKPDLNIPQTLFESECEICFSTVSANEHSVWPPCCKKRIFHRLCMQKYAWKSGLHHFSCPACKSKDPFLEAMQNSGVYVPEQDAEWEAERLFADLEQVYSHCDAEDCLCPHGREYNSADKENRNKKDYKNWKIVRCGICGAKATHYSCSQLNKISWKCSDCVTVITRAPTLYEKDFTSSSSSSSSSYEDDDEDEGEDFNQTNENCRVVIAGRSSLVGVERSANDLSNPVDYITNPQSEEVAAGTGKIIYNRKFKKKYKVVVENDISESEDEEDTPAFTRASRRVSCNSFRDYLNANTTSKEDGTKVFTGSLELFSKKLAQLRFSCKLQGILSSSSDNTHSVGHSQVQPAENSDSSIKHLNSLLKIKNLDLSEHKSQILAKTCTFPTLEQNEIESENQSKSRDDVSSTVSPLDEHTAETVPEVSDEPSSSRASVRSCSSTRSRSKLNLAHPVISEKSDGSNLISVQNNDDVSEDVPPSDAMNLVATKFKEKLEELISSKGKESPCDKVDKDFENVFNSLCSQDDVKILKVTHSPTKKVTEVIDVESEVTPNSKRSSVDTVTLDDEDDDNGDADLEIIVEKKVRTKNQEVSVILNVKPNVVKSSALMDILNGELNRGSKGPLFRRKNVKRPSFSDEVVMISDDEGSVGKKLGTRKRTAGLGLRKSTDTVVLLSDEEEGDVNKSGVAQRNHGEPTEKKSSGKSSSTSSSCDFGSFQNSSKTMRRVSSEGDSHDKTKRHKEEFTIEVKRPRKL